MAFLCIYDFISSMKENPWTRISEKHIYSNPWIDVAEHQVLNPAGNQGIYGKVHFKNIALGIIPLDNDMNIWLVGQYRYTLDEYTWEIPMGGGLIGTPILESAQRELREETGLIASKWNNILKIHTSNSVTDEVGFVFVARGLTLGETEFDETEQLVVKKLPLSEAIEMVMNNEITDSISMAGLLKLSLMIDKNKI